MNFMELLVAKNSPLDYPAPEYWCEKCKDRGWFKWTDENGKSEIIICGMCPAGDQIREEAEI